jgi:hypothetical protein
MNKIKQLAATVNANRGAILKRTVVIAAGVVAVTVAASLFKAEVAEVIEAAAE